MTLDVLAEVYRKTGREKKAAPLEKRATAIWAKAK